MLQIVDARLWPVVRAGLTWVNGTSVVAVVIAAVARARLRRGPGGVLIATGYRLPLPRQRCFTIGCVIFTRGDSTTLLGPDCAALLGHETRHVAQYAVLGPLFWPAYWLASGYSWTTTGGYGSHNVFEQLAGLADGGYPELPAGPVGHGRAGADPATR
jgi:hypothetical protein